ncbi:MAG TPA: transposase [Sulfurospirillum arcachonense]|nr:transposase [Sulfurospirillum arcachonense]
MARRLRVEICGYHHVYNRGVAKKRIFLKDRDREKFLEILEDVSKEFKFNIHSFCLMDNHYHLLIENKKENLSDGMRQIGSRYASYFNKTYKRVGHLWQDRFKSWYVMDENYLITLFKYIESNPVKANMSSKIGEYKYSASYSILKDGVPSFLQNSFILRDYDTSVLFDMFDIPLSQKDIENIDKFHKIKYKQDDGDIVQSKKQSLEYYFRGLHSKKERNKAILNAYEDDYTKSEIAKQIGLSGTGVAKIIKKFIVGG